MKLRDPIHRAPSALLLAAILLSPACTREEAEDKAKELADKAGDKGKELANQAGDKGKELAGELWNELPDNGQLSASAVTMFDKAAAAAGDGGVEAWIAKGEQMAPVAMEVGKTLVGAVDSDHQVEPIIQDLADEDAQRQLDARIADMPRVETIEGVSVGFKDMTQYDTGGRSSESAYLILWRREDKLLGMVYRSKQRINVDVLIKEAPRLIALVQKSL